MGVDSGGSLSVIILERAAQWPNGGGVAWTSYLSGWKGMLVARFDAIAVVVGVSKGPAWMTTVSSARVDRGVVLFDVALDRSDVAQVGSLSARSESDKGCRKRDVAVISTAAMVSQPRALVSG